MVINNSISKYDWQYLVTGFFLISVFIFTDLIGVIDKEYFYFVPKLISDQPHRIFASILIHADLNHLLSNLGGIIITRYFLMRLGIESRFFYLKFILISSFLNLLFSKLSILEKKFSTPIDFNISKGPIAQLKPSLIASSMSLNLSVIPGTNEEEYFIILEITDQA